MELLFSSRISDFFFPPALALVQLNLLVGAFAPSTKYTYIYAYISLPFGNAIEEEEASLISTTAIGQVVA